MQEPPRAIHPGKRLAQGFGLFSAGVLLLALVLLGLAALLRPARSHAAPLLISTAYAADVQQCKGTRRDGERCRNRVKGERPYCRFHKAQDPRAPKKAEPSEVPK
jgi:hypothetical protein